MTAAGTERQREDAARDDVRLWLADVIVTPKPGVNDPQGEAIRGGLAMLGYAAVQGVRSGRFFQVRLDAADAEAAGAAVAAMCEQLLANPVIETYQVSVSEIIPERGDEIVGRE